jgi:uncharacterized membrane protein
MFSDVKLALRNALLLVLLMYFSFLMLEITLQYIPIDLDVAFLRIKHDVIGLTHYQIAFFTHVFTSMFALLAGFTQFSFFLRKKYPLVHRGIGKLYVVVILLLSGPSGLIMAYYANGGWSSQWAFMLLAMMWMYTTWKAFSTARNKQFDEHRFWMIRSYALTLSAITLRFWKWLIVGIFEPAPMDVYRIVAWMGWIPNLLLAEFIIYKNKKG